ncbi:hypothetical protein MMC2321_05351 [Chitinophaga sp. MM2321]
MGIAPITKSIQLESLDLDLRNSLWNVYTSTICSKIQLDRHQEGLNTLQRLLANHLWHNVYKKAIDTIPFYKVNLLSYFRKEILESEWYQALELIEESVNYLYKIGSLVDLESVEATFNEVLEREFSGYRFINGLIAPISNKREIKEIEEAISVSNVYSALNGCNIHLSMALAKLSDKLNPDYRNSIKESISAVESLAKVISGKTSDTLNSAIDRVKSKLKIHKSLEQGLKNLYNYTSDADGIRHGLMDDPNSDFEDAKFMLISCSAFINYLIAKANKAGITINQV